MKDVQLKVVTAVSNGAVRIMRSGTYVILHPGIQENIWLGKALCMGLEGPH